MLSIITTNRNSTITAPTYTTTSVMPRNSACISIHIIALIQKVSTRYSAACTGFFTVTVFSAPNRMMAANR